MMAASENSSSQKIIFGLLTSLEGQYATLEFVDNTAIRGRIDHVNGFMDIEMSDVTYTTSSGVSTQFAAFGCQGKFVRYVQLPDDLDGATAIQDGLERLAQMPMRRGRGGRGRGGFRSRGGGFRGSRGGRGSGYNPQDGGDCKYGGSNGGRGRDRFAGYGNGDR